MNISKAILKSFKFIGRKAIEIAKHPRTKQIFRQIFRQIFSLLKIKVIRGIVLLYFAGLFSQLGNMDLAVGCCLLLLIDNIDLILGHGNIKRRYY